MWPIPLFNTDSYFCFIVQDSKLLWTNGKITPRRTTLRVNGAWALLEHDEQRNSIHQTLKRFGHWILSNTQRTRYGLFVFFFQLKQFSVFWRIKRNTTSRVSQIASKGITLTTANFRHDRLFPSYPSHCFNPLNPKIKIWIPICCPYSFPTEVVGRSW